MSHKAVRILIVDEMLELRRRGITLREIGEMVVAAAYHMGLRDGRNQTTIELDQVFNLDWW